MARKASAAERPNVGDDVIAAAQAWWLEHEVAHMRLLAQKAAKIRKFEAEGVDFDAIRNTHRLAKLDRDVRRLRLELDARYLRLARLVEWEQDGQSTFAAALNGDGEARAIAPDPRLASARAFNDGYNTARAGGAIEASPFHHIPGSEEFTRWRDGWQDGKEDRVLVKPDAEQTTQAAPRKRGRPSNASRQAAAQAAAEPVF